MTTPTEKPKKLTKKQKKFIDEYLKEGSTGTSAALAAYNIGGKHGTDNPEKVASAIAVENLSKPAIAARLGDRISDDLVIERINDLLNKKETVWEKDPNTGEPVQKRTKEIHVPGVSKGVEFATRMKGVFNPETPPDAPKGNTYNFFYKPEIRAVTDKYDQELKDVLYKDKKPE